jgi:hypothetical protein
MAYDYTWKIESIDEDQATMVVAYTHEGQALSLNLHQPPARKDLAEWVNLHAPTSTWLRAKTPATRTITVGETGSGTFAMVDAEPEHVFPTEGSNIAGDMNEEYLRAIVYQVLEEIKESSV